MSKQRVFDIFNFTKPQPDKLTSLNKPKLKSNSDNDSDSVDSELLALSSFSSSTSCLNETDDESTNYKNLLKNDEKIDLGDLQSGPIRPVLKSYPMTKFGNQKRCFNASYFNEYDWLEYSIQHDALYCFPCRNFSANDNEGTFSKTGFRNWKKLSGSRGITGKKQTKLKAHASTKSHLTCVAKWLGHKNTETIGSVHTQLSTQHKLEVEANKSYIKTLIDIALYLSCQGLPFRGHDESTDSLNKGNFKEACQLMSKYVPEFSVKFLKTTNYTSPLVQNSIIEMCAKNVRDQIISEDLLSISVDSLKAEMIVAKNVIIQTYSTSKELITDNLKLILQENVYPNLFHLYKVAITLPISSSTCERSFSAMRRIKTWLRTSMLQDRFTQVSILYIEKNDTKNINKDIILKQFAEEHKYIMLKRGPRSFRDLKTVNGVVHATYAAAAVALGLLEDDEAWRACMTESSALDTATQLRYLYVTILLFCHPADPADLYRRFEVNMMEDFNRRFQNVDRAKAACLKAIRDLLRARGKSLDDYGLPSPDEDLLEPDQDDPMFGAIDAAVAWQQRLRELNDEQRTVYDRVMAAVDDNRNVQKMFYVDGPGGTGKTTLYGCLISSLRNRQQTVVKEPCLITNSYH
eukprot:XP_016656038.1 PREDICTED: uncharacterized protein LOC107882336 [Acyrthosiphon pisum]